MNTDYFFAQDQAGTRCKVNVLRRAGDNERRTSAAAAQPAPVYQLEDGSALQRVDSDTFRVIGTGAYITVVRD
ncbi:hypothetical protein [Pseudoxanthomonas wuyuanensis]|uniref:Uncharacterized protein n=1 Tax=Pseudoxanthomonas wuyuanensis TaxID=1073196 RepID=A0A286D2Y9_9GAMM|nr:hypothetical protein [Pseudoxanthomonas wuyuanensis]KAF1723036.1 hypothetical protein CSC75_00670 [Pseudoxanthomonas wuyuanensis]SOD53025.1 hypothetical protein SAMN06296416_102200 [Pseudoxanthomonas wuyuanensis]